MDYSFGFTATWLIISAMIFRYYNAKRESETLYYEDGEKEYLLSTDKNEIIRTTISVVILFLCFFLDDYFNLNEFEMSFEVPAVIFAIFLVFIIRRFRFYNYRVDLSTERLTVYDGGKTIFDHKVSDILYLSENRKLNVVFGFRVYTRGDDSVYISRDIRNFELLKMKVDEYREKARNSEK